MATKGEIIAEIKNNVFEYLEEKEVNSNDRPGGLRTYDAACLVVTNAEGNKVKQTQTFYVKDEGTNNESAWLGSRTIKNYVAPTPTSDLIEQDFLTKLNAIESEIGQGIKVDVNDLKNLGIKYFVYVDPRDDKKYVTTHLMGKKLVREVA